MKKPTRADLRGALLMIKGRRDYHLRTGDPFGVTYAEAAMYAVEKLLKEMPEKRGKQWRKSE